MSLRIAGIYEGTIDDTNMWFHHKYLDEAMKNWGQVGMWWLRAESAEVVPGSSPADQRGVCKYLRRGPR